MRASYLTDYGKPADVIEIGEQPDPLVGPDSVLISVRAASVNPVDWKVVGGHLRGLIPHHTPLIPGWDVAGVVDAVGPAVVDFTAGDRVLAYGRTDHVQLGTYAERVSLPQRTVAALPDGVDFVSGAALPLAGMTAEQLLDAADVGARDTVLVHAAAGGVGGFAVQLARMRGAGVIGTASERNHAFLRERGVTPTTYGDGLVERVREIAPDGIDVVIDTVGGEALAATPELLARGGRVASIIEPEAVADLGGRYVFVQADRTMLGRLAGLVASGDLQVDVAATYPLERVADALTANMDGHTRGKIVITVG